MPVLPDTARLGAHEEPLTWTGGDTIVHTLAALGVTHVFGVASIHNLPIYDALARHGTITSVSMRHEQAAVHAADGFSRATGQLGVAITSTGPGAANSMGGLFEASVACSPVLMITGQVESRYYGQGRGPTHEADRQQDMLRSITRRVDSVRHGQDLGQVLSDLAHELRAGRPQPGAIEVPIDLQYRRTPAGVARIVEPRPVPVDEQQLDRILTRLEHSDRPLIWAGGGVISADAGGEVTRLAERLQAPVIMTVEGRGSIADDHPLSLGATSEFEVMADVLAHADVVLALGTRFRATATKQWQLRLNGALIHVDVDPSAFGRTYEPDVAVVADVRLAAAHLAASTAVHDGPRPYAQLARRQSREAIDLELGRIGADHRQILETIRRALPRTGNIVRDSTVPAYLWADRLLPVLHPRTSMRPVSVAIGPGLPMAIGAALGTGEPAVVIQGDGGLMLSLGELATAVQYRAPIVVCVFNDHGYGVLRAIEATRFDGRQFGVDLATPDFAALGDSMGVYVRAVSSPRDFAEAFEHAIDAGGPWLLDIDMRALAPMELPAW